MNFRSSSRSFARRLVGPSLVLAALLAPLAVLAGDAPEKPTRFVIAREGASFLEEIEGQQVLHLSGTPYEMGLAHGKLMKEQARECMDAYVKDFAFGVMHYDMTYLQEIWKEAKPFMPPEYLEEMRGLACGSGIPLEEIEAGHIIPELHHCSGAAVFGKMTRDGKLYHYRSLDYSLDLGKKKRIQENATLIIRKPDKGYATVVVGWAGTLGCVTGMNDQGISIGEMGSSSYAETFKGTPMWFRVRWILENARSLDEGIAGFRDWKRTCGYNFILTDGKIPDARAVEVDRLKAAFFAPGGAEENVAPHYAIPDAVRRVNHFVDRELSARQRRPYDPVTTTGGSWDGYKRIGEYLLAEKGKLDGEGMITLCRGYPKDHSCLHQAVFCTTDLDFWVANAKDPAKGPLAGAQNQRFYAYNLKDLLATDPAKLEKKVSLAPPPPPSRARYVSDEREGDPEAARLAAMERTVREIGSHHEDAKPLDGEKLAALIGGVPTGEASEPALEPRDEDPVTARALSVFARPAGKFGYRIVEKERLSSYAKYELRLPSAAHTTDNSDVVAGVYYEPLRRKANEKLPGVVVVHHLGGSFEAEEVLAAYLSQHGVSSVTLALPGYGIRASKGQPRAGFLGHENPVDDFAGMRQAVLDVRRCADFLRSRPEVDGERVGVVGVSLGALVAADAGGIDTRFARVTLVIGGGDFMKVLNNGSSEAKEAMAHVKKLGVTDEQLEEGLRLVDPLTYAARLRSQDTLMLNAEKDEIFPRASTDELWRKAGYPRIKWYPCGHYGMAVHLFDVMAETLDHLRGKAPSREPD